MGEWRRTLLLFLASALIGSCQSTSPSEKEDLKGINLTGDDLKKFEELRAEIEIGRNMAGRLLAFYGASDNRRLVQYINEIGTLISQYSDHPERRYVFDVIEHDEPNAFACPGGIFSLPVAPSSWPRRKQNLLELLPMR